MMKKRLQIFASLLLISGLALTAPYTTWNDDTSLAGFVSICLGTVASIVAIFIPSSVTHEFRKSDWEQQNAGEGQCFRVSAKIHGCGKNPKITVYKMNGRSFSEVITGVEHDDRGNISLEAKLGFDGKITVV